MSRAEIMLSLFDSSGFGLEIGPSFNPLVPKAAGYNVEILDHLDTAGLVDKYRTAVGIDVARIEAVDYVSTGASVFDAIRCEKRFDYIVASHVVEHTTDLLLFFLDCERLLKEGGQLVLAVPDKRWSFDALRPTTSTGDVLQAHLEKRTRHTPGAVFDEVAYNVLRGGAIAWPPGNADELKFFAEIASAKQTFEDHANDGLFRDIHNWQFVPSSFRLIANDLFEIGMLGLRESAFVDNGGGEFYMSMSTTGSGPSVSRLHMAEQSMVEQRAVVFASDPPEQPPSSESSPVPEAIAAPDVNRRWRRQPS